MELEKLINNDLKEAMKAKNRRKLEALRAIKAALLLEKTGKDVADGEIPESVELKLLQKLVKQRKESAVLYREQNRPELAEEEEYQVSIIEKYLPEQMSEEEVKSIIEKIVADTGASSMKDMGRVMGIAAKQLAGKADNKAISNIVKGLLS
ncbi:MAG: GatB/YqeY domain-containing protein [Bacteroidetes bacterium]|nr:MAG: GatB/YqeY domain-containing protein [Bacteroidota bacterium]